MHYNLLYYGVNNSWCNQTNNNIQLKNASLRTIIDYVQPDIFTVNEISSSVAYHDMILDSVFNINGVTKYQRGVLTNYSSTSIVNQLYYDSEKFAIANQYALVGGDRDINVYKMYYKSPELGWSTDTVFITFIVAHLASGSYSQDIQDRDDEVAIVMNHMGTLPSPNNYVFQGDFNFYTSSEGGFQRIINNSNANIRFFDPPNKVGAWSDNSTYAEYHTQSTHTTGDCFIGGGLDDRFDFIMTSLPIIMDSYKVKYVPNSYTTPGQDGQRLNQSLIDSPTNTSAPGEVIQALYNMSDHLPVYLDLRIDQIPANITESFQTQFSMIAENPVDQIIRLHFFLKGHEDVIVSLFDLTGRNMFSDNFRIHQYDNIVEIQAGWLAQGVYVLHVSNGKSFQQSVKVLKL